MANKVFTKITSGPDARKKILNGVNAVANVVGSTMGYRGSTVLLERDGLPEPTKDGYDVAESVFLEDEVEALACETAKEASRKTMDEAGDNTTATMVLLQAFLQNSFKELDNGRSRIDIKLEIEKSRDLVVDYLDKLATVLENSIGTLTFSYVDIGSYTINSSNLFIVGATTVMVESGNAGGPTTKIQSIVADGNTILLWSSEDAIPVDQMLGNTMIEIRIYN